MRPALAAALLFVLLGSGCSEPRGSHQASIYVFGTVVDVTVRDVGEEPAQRAFRRIEQTFRQMHRDWHAWEPGPLTEINAAIAAGEPVEVIPSLRPVITQSQALSRQSGGAFNPAIGGLLNLWGFQQNEPPDGPPPSKEAVARWVASAPSMSDLHLEEGLLRSDNRAVQLDFGAFAKGYAVDVAIGILRQFGIEHAIVNAGGDLRAIGRHGDRPWRVGIRHPQGSGVLGSLQVSGDEAVFTSGNYERFREHEGVRYAHILDPATGWPVEGITSVTVIHDNGAEADAAATALVVAGVEEWPGVAAGMGIGHVMLVDETGTVYMNRAMAERVELRGAEPPNVVLREIR